MYLRFYRRRRARPGHHSCAGRRRPGDADALAHRRTAPYDVSDQLRDRPPRLRSPLKRLLSGQHWLFAAHVAVILFLCILILYPVLILLDLSFRDDDGALVARQLRQHLHTLRNYQAILNTILIASGTALCSVMVGTFLAWAVVRTDMPGRGLIELSSIIPFISTPLVGALAWILLASPQTGLINQAWHFVGGDDALINIYSVWAIVFVRRCTKRRSCS